LHIALLVAGNNGNMRVVESTGCSAIDCNSLHGTILRQPTFFATVGADRDHLLVVMIGVPVRSEVL